MSSDEILEDEDKSELLEELNEAETVASSDYNTVLMSENYAFKIRRSSEDTRRYGSRLSARLVPETSIRKLDLEELDEFEGSKDVIIQKKAEEKLEDRLEESNPHETEVLGDLIYLLDIALEENIAITDPIIDNFAFFDGKLKLFDYCDMESSESFPDSYDSSPEEEFVYAAENMYEDAVVSVAEAMSAEQDEIAEVFVETSKYLESMDTDHLFPDAHLSELPVDYI